MSYGTMPSAWVAEGKLKELPSREGVAGRSIAALKCYLAIAAYLDWHSGSAVLSMYDLTQITKVSKPMVLEGIAFLQALGLVEVEVKAVSNTNRYRLPGFTQTTFRKVPQDTIRRSLHAIGNRGVRHVEALKLYLAMIHLRDGATSKAIASHESLISYTGTRPDDLAAAASVLAACGLIHIRQSEQFTHTGHPTNEYNLLGDFSGQRPFMLRPAEQRKKKMQAVRN